MKDNIKIFSGKKLETPEYYTKPKPINRRELSDELRDSIAIAESDGGTVSDFAIATEQRVETGEITSEIARELIKKHYGVGEKRKGTD